MLGTAFSDGKPPCLCTHLPTFCLSLQTTPCTRRSAPVFCMSLRTSALKWCGNPHPWQKRRALQPCTGARTPTRPVIANQCLAPADTRHVSAHLARRVLATADTPPSSACHCEPVRTLVWQSVPPAAAHNEKQHVGRIRNRPRIRLKCYFFLPFPAGTRIATSLRSSQ